MATQKGKDLLLKIDDGTGFSTVAGLRTKTLAFNAQSVDVTHADSAGRWRELLAGAGVKRASRVASVARPSGRTLTATSRSSLVSRAR